MEDGPLIDTMRWTSSKHMFYPLPSHGYMFIFILPKRKKNVSIFAKF
jgi:hypothetical protein